MHKSYQNVPSDIAGNSLRTSL